MTRANTEICPNEASWDGHPIRWLARRMIELFGWGARREGYDNTLHGSGWGGGVVLAGMAQAQTGRDLAGTWQGTLPVGKGERLVVKIAKEGSGWSGATYDLDSNTPSEPRGTTQITLAGAEVRFAIPHRRQLHREAE